MYGRGFGPGIGPGVGPGAFGPSPFFHGFGLLLAVFWLSVFVVLAVAFWNLYRKAGFDGVYGLLMLVPGVNLGVVLFLAFADWPVLKRLREREV